MEVRDKYLELFIQKVKDKFGDELQRIILFGSRARGDNDPSSDYDLILVFDKITCEIKEVIGKLEDEMLLNHFVLFSALLFTQQILEEREYEPFLMNAKKEGISLHESE